MKNITFPILAERFAQSIDQYIREELRREGINDLQPCHGYILKALLANPVVSVMELSVLTHKSKSTVSIHAHKLEECGYIEKRRSPLDARLHVIMLTPKGRALEPVMRQTPRMEQNFSQAGTVQIGFTSWLHYMGGIGFSIRGWHKSVKAVGRN